MKVTISSSSFQDSISASVLNRGGTGIVKTNRPGPFCFKIVEDVYYNSNTSSHANENMTPTNGHIFIYDGEEAVNYRKTKDNILKNDILHKLQNMFKEHNVHDQSYLMMQEEIDFQKENLATNDMSNEIPELRICFYYQR